jgi:hypothetical protein
MEGKGRAPPSMSGWRCSGLRLPRLAFPLMPPPRAIAAGRGQSCPGRRAALPTRPAAPRNEPHYAAPRTRTRPVSSVFYVMSYEMDNDESIDRRSSRLVHFSV